MKSGPPSGEQINRVLFQHLLPQWWLETTPLHPIEMKLFACLHHVIMSSSTWFFHYMQNKAAPKIPANAHKRTPRTYASLSFVTFVFTKRTRSKIHSLCHNNAKRPQKHLHTHMGKQKYFFTLKMSKYHMIELAIFCITCTNEAVSYIYYRRTTTWNFEYSLVNTLLWWN